MTPRFWTVGLLTALMWPLAPHAQQTSEQDPAGTGGSRRTLWWFAWQGFIDGAPLAEAAESPERPMDSSPRQVPPFGPAGANVALNTAS
jgi:hypothetical protein